MVTARERKRLSLLRGELKRLKPAKGEEDWRIVSAPEDPDHGRTRGGGNLRAAVVVVDSDSSSDEEEQEEPDVVEEAEAEAEAEVEEGAVVARKKQKPANNRVVLELDQIDKVFGQLACRECGDPVKVTVRNICIATSIGIECMNEECGFLYHPEPPAATTIHLDRPDNFERSTDYAVNVLYVIGFMSMGDGGTEAARLLGLLGLPNDTTMKSRSFTIIENRIGPIIRTLGKEVILDNLIEEARLSMEASSTQDVHDFNLWKTSLTDKSIKLSRAKMPKIHGSYDMAWQQKGSGHQYNSLSGHGTLVGRWTRKVVGLLIKCKVCNACKAWEKKHQEDGVAILPHNCYKNHEGSSGSMESAALLEIVVQCYDKFQVIVEMLCCDDDSSLRADCQWSNADYLKNNNTDVLPMIPKRVGKNKGELQPRPDKGKLPAHVPEPTFVADPNHRRKVLSGDLIKLDTACVKEKATMTRMDTTRITKNFGYMVRALKTKPQCKFIDAANAVLDHHFDVHNHCGAWCPRKMETTAQRNASKKYYRSMEKDAKLYAILKEKMARFVTLDKLQEVAHPMDTNMNEGFNNICTWFLPKNKVFAGSGSLNNRISIAVCINSIGVLPFYTKLLRKLGIAMSDNVHHYLECKETARMRKIECGKTSQAKKDRNNGKYIKLRADTRIAKMEHLKRAGVYKRGMNMDDPFGELLNGKEQDEELVDGARKPAAKKRKIQGGFCEWCSLAGHFTKRSKVCKAALDAPKKYRRHDGSPLSGPPFRIDDSAFDEAVGNNALLSQAALDVARMDSLPFDHTLQSDEEVSLARFLLEGGSDGEDDEEDGCARPL
jgi:hypothetical protein